MMNHKSYTRQTKWLALLGLGFFAGCSFFGDDPVEQVPEIEAEPEAQWIEAQEVGPVTLYDNVFEVDRSTLQHAEVGDDILTVPISEAGSLRDRQVGEIIYSENQPLFGLEIAHIETRDDQLVFSGEEPELTDVIKEGKFQVYLPPAIVDEQGMAVDKEDLIIDMVDDTSHQEFQQRHQELIDREIDVMSADYSTDFSDYDVLELTHGNTTLRVNGELRFRPGVVATVEVSGFSASDIAVGLEASGQAKLEAGWELEVAEAFNMGRSFDLPVTTPVNFSVLFLQFTVEPFLAGRTKASGSGEATYSQNFVAQGGVAAGVTAEIGSTPEPYFTTNFSTRNDQRAERPSLVVGMEASLKLQIEAGVRLYLGGNTNGSKLAEAVPLQATFTANGQLDQHNCSYDAELTFDAYARTYVPSNYWDYNYDGFSTEGDFSAPGCMREDKPDQCQIDTDCRTSGITSGAQMACVSGTCEPDSDMLITLDWDDDLNLDLYVSTPDDVIISNEEPEPDYTNGHMFEASCGGCEGAESAQGAQGYTEQVLFDGADVSDEFHIWVVNTDGMHDESSEQEVIPYRLTLNHRDVFEETFTSRMSTEAGTSSVVYRYKVPELPADDDDGLGGG